MWRSWVHNELDHPAAFVFDEVGLWLQGVDQNLLYLLLNLFLLRRPLVVVATGVNDVLHAETCLLILRLGIAFFNKGRMYGVHPALQRFPVQQLRRR